MPRIGFEDSVRLGRNVKYARIHFNDSILLGNITKNDDKKYIIRIVADGTLTFDTNNVKNVKYEFENGDVLYGDDIVGRSVANGEIIKVSGQDWKSGVPELKCNNSILGSNLNEFPPLTHYASFYNTSVSGDISALSNVTHWADFYNTSVSGDISALSNVTYLASFDNTSVSGDISALSNVTHWANFGNTSVSGILSPHSNLKYLYLNGTNMSSNDTDQTIINLDNNTTVSGTLKVVANRTTASDSAFNSLVAKGWSITEV